MRKLGRTLSIAWGLVRLCLRRPPDSRKPAAELERVLILGYAAMGDQILFLPALRALRAAIPRARITFAANKYPTTEELLPATGLIDDIWELDVPASGAAERAARRRIREGRFDAVILSQPTPARPFAEALRDIPLRAGHCRPVSAPHEGWSFLRYAAWRLRRALISDEIERRLMLNRKVWVAEDEEHTVSRNLRLIRALGLPPGPLDARRPDLPEPAAAKAAASAALAAARSGRIVGVHVGSPRSQYGKIWPAGRWGEVCRRLADRYGVEIALLGGEDERGNAADFAAAFKGPFLDLAGKLKLLETFSAMRRFILILSNDTGMSKAGMALGVPTATVWGPSDRPGYGRVWEPEKHLEIFRDIPCSPCVRMGLRQEGSGVINYDTCGHRACLAELTPEAVFEAIRARYGSLLGSPPKGGN